MSTPLPSLLSSLLGLITTATSDLQSELSNAGLPEPWIDHARFHPWDDETPSKKYWDARRTLISALGMMTAVVQNPREKIISDVIAYHFPATINFIVNTHIPDILAEPDVDESVGLPIAEIARRAGTHVAKTERVLRFLCIHHIFQETSSAVFANNKISICLKKGQPTADVPLYWGDVGFRSSTAFSNTLRAPNTAFSVRHEDAPFSEVFSDPGAGNVGKLVGTYDAAASGVVDTKATQEKEEAGHDTHGSDNTKGNTDGISLHKSSSAPTPARAVAFEFLARPENGTYRTAFAQGMVTLEIMNGALGYHDFTWGRWDVEGSVIVEAGASAGHLSLSVLPLLKHARFVNQDRPEVCLEGEKFFAEKNPEAITSGRVTFQPNDFFTGQPVKGAEIYILSNILHDWPDVEALNILKHIADAMTPASRLLVIEIVIVPAISQSRSLPPTEEEKDVNDAPWPLLKDYGLVNRYPHLQSMELISLFNGLDRTLDEYVSMFHKTGLELVQVHRIRKLVSIMEVKKMA